MNLQTAGLSDIVQTAMYRDLIKALRADAVYAIPESVLPLQRVEGNNLTALASMWTDVAPSLTPLAEGVPPQPTKMAEDNVTASITEVGGYIPIYSQANYELSSLMSAATDKAARQAFLAFDSLAKSLYAAGDADVFAGDATDRASLDPGDVLTSPIVDELVTRARENDLMPFADGLYRIIGHPRLFAPLLTETLGYGAGFAPAANEGKVGDLTHGVIGDWHGARFISAGSRGITASAGPSGPTVYRGVLIGQRSIALTDLGTITTVVQPGGGPTDPLRQIIATVGWRGFIGGCLVDLANFSDGAGNLDASIKRSVSFEATGK